VERAGCGSGPKQGSITAFYTVLTEGDDHNDPIADAARAILDGHIVLSRQIAEGGLYPAIDVEASISRLMNDIVDQDNVLAARRFRQLYSTYEQHRDMISVGAYHKGSDPRVDEAIDNHPRLVEFMRQDMAGAVSLEQSLQQIIDLMAVRQEHSDLLSEEDKEKAL
jgi:flagellum-specific ATP synthase